MTKSNKKSKKNDIPKRSAKEEKLFQNLLKITQQFMAGKSFFSLDEIELQRKLNIPLQHHLIFKEVLNEIVDTGLGEYSNNRYQIKKKSEEVVSGIIRVHPRGFGFLQADNPTLYPEDIFIPKHLTLNAVDGDAVEVVVNQDVISEKGPEGKVVTIVERSRTHIGGIIRNIDSFGEISAYVPLLGLSQKVLVQSTTEFKLRVGDRLVLEVLDWGSKETETRCKVSRYIGHISDPSCDISAALEEYELRTEFPQHAIEEAQSYGKQVSSREIKNREDLRELVCFTIDPDTAKDFDDAVSLSRTDNGGYLLGVHIADVSHYVLPGSALDKEAGLRCNSTYFPNFCLPMLPHELSSNLCSLKANVNRLTISVFVNFDRSGNQLDYRISRSVIKSKKRFTYKEAKLVLDGKKTSIYASNLKLMVELCALLKRKRYERGSLEFAMPDLIVIVDDKGTPQKTEYVTYDVTHQLVEEFMLKANEIVATHLSKLGKNLPYRIHDLPAEENMKDFAVLANAFGFELSDHPTPSELQKLFDEAMQTPYGQYLATNYIRRMRLAIYSPENIGHYGLGLTHYCHFTSPIRRYVDLVAHRILFGESDNLEALSIIAEQCSNQERISAKAENSVVLLKKLRLIDDLQKKDAYKQHEAIVTRVKGFGFFFEILDFMLESFFHVSELDDDYYVYDEVKMLLSGRRHGQNYCSGDRITVMLKDVNFITLESRWNLVSTESKPKKPPSRKERFAKKPVERKPFASARGGPAAKGKKKSVKPSKKRR